MSLDRDACSQVDNINRGFTEGETCYTAPDELQGVEGEGGSICYKSDVEQGATGTDKWRLYAQ